MEYLYTLGKWAEIIGGKVVGNPSIQVDEIITDSRDFVHRNRNVMFAALRTKNNDGHKFIEHLIDNKVKLFLVDNSDIAEKFKEYAHFIICENTLIALQLMAGHHRLNCTWPFLAITGSNGKTIVKEWLYHFLSPLISVYKSPRSYNSQLGVPLSILQIRKEYALSILEAGISQSGEMEHLKTVIRPDYGLLTWFGDAHAEGFKSEEEKWKEKILLFADTKKTLLHVPKQKWPLFIHTKKQHFVSLSEHEDADYCYNLQSSIENGELCITHCSGRKILLQHAFQDEAVVRNLATCLVFIDVFYPEFLSSAISEVPHLPTIQTRLDITKGVQGSTIIHDYYSSDPDSLKIALNVLHKQAGKNKKKIVILSEFDQLGINELEMNQFILNELSEFEADKILLIGESFVRQKSTDKLKYYKNTNDFLKRKNEWLPFISNSVVLIKGARKYALEKIGREINLKTHQTKLEIYPERIRHNIRFFRSKLKPNTKIMAMVKAMGYGAGNVELALFFQQCGINYLAVAFADEGVELRNAGIHLPIMVMNPEHDGWEMCAEHDLEPVIYSNHGLNKLKEISYLLSEEKPLRIHIEFDTGMHRLGFKTQKASEIGKELIKIKGIKVETAFTHFVASENPEFDAFSKKQWQELIVAAEELMKIIGEEFILHICNTAGTVRFPWAHADMVRLGIGLYGIPACMEEKEHLKLALRWVTGVSQIHELKENETVGYGRKFMASKNTKIATIPVGYADGFSRIYGNGQATLKIRGKHFPTAGNICMDMCMIDVSSLPQITENDEVIIFENLEELESLAKTAGTIPYEIISTISSRVKRVYAYD
jgi:alanine racemase